MAHKVKVFVRPKKGILDPQGKAVEGALKSLGYKGIHEVRVGKLIEFIVEDGGSRESLDATVREMSEKILSNPIIEQFTFDVEAGEA